MINLQRLKELRTERNLSQSEVGDILGITQQAYANYERGAREPDFVTLIKLADYLNVSVDYLLGRESTQENSNPHLQELINVASNLSDENIQKAIDYIELLKLKQN